MTAVYVIYYFLIVLGELVLTYLEIIATIQGKITITKVYSFG